MTLIMENTNTAPQQASSIPTAPWVNQSQPTVVQKATQTVQAIPQKKSSNWILIGCWLFFVFLLILIGVWLTAALNSPSTLQSLGRSLDTVKQFLKVIILVVAWLFLFVWVWLFWINVYRLLTTKEGSKLWYIIWSLFGFIIMIAAVWWGALGFSKVNAYSDRVTINSSSLINPYLQVLGWSDRRWLNWRVYTNTLWLKIIWPANIQMQFNKTAYDKLYNNLIPFQQIDNIVIDCGNWQNLNWSKIWRDSEFIFNKSCFYKEKWLYTVNMALTYRDKNTWLVQTKSFSWVSNVDVISQIDISSSDEFTSISDDKSEFVIWSTPVRVGIQTNRVMSDLWLENPLIERDIDWDWIKDDSNPNFSTNISKAWLRSIYYRFPTLPWYNWMWYRLNLRVNPSTVEPCKLSVSQVGSWEYRIDMSVTDSVQVKSREVEVIDAKTQLPVETLTNLPTVYRLPWAWAYAIRWIYYTQEWKKWVCESQWLNSNVQFYYLKTTVNIESSAGKITTWSQEDTMTVKVPSLPATIQITIDDIIPQPNRPTLTATLWEEIINPYILNQYRIKLSENKTTEFIVTITDADGKKASKKIIFEPSIKPIIAKVSADKKVGYDPLNVRLDASISQLNDSSDEVVYFSWDFGDWQKTDNVSQWSINHVYRFDIGKQEWRYKPKVTIKTQKWYEDTIELEDYIIVKRELRQIKIVSPSNPAQLARIWDEISITAQTDWAVKAVKWDFGNQESKQCDNRTCLDTTVTYLNKWIYDIIVVVEYADHPSVTQTYRLKVD